MHVTDHEAKIKYLLIYLQTLHLPEDLCFENRSLKFTSLVSLLFDLCWTLAALIDVSLETKVLHLGFGD